jgi:hypothetical protein
MKAGEAVRGIVRFGRRKLMDEPVSHGWRLRHDPLPQRPRTRGGY